MLKKNKKIERTENLTWLSLYYEEKKIHRLYFQDIEWILEVINIFVTFNVNVKETLCQLLSCKIH